MSASLVKLAASIIFKRPNPNLKRVRCATDPVEACVFCSAHMDDGALSAVRVDAAACLPHATVQDYCCVELGPSTLTRMQAGAHATNATDRHGRTDRDVHPDPPPALVRITYISQGNGWAPS